jgi:hypothetical protein
MFGSLVPVTVAGQSDRVAVRFSPKAGQVFRMRTTTDIAFVVNGATAPVRLESKAVSAVTVSFGYANDAGRFDSDAVVDDFAISSTLNGTVVPAAPVQVPVVGRHIGVTYDAAGTAVDLRVPDDLTAALPVLKQMLASVNRGFPIGETIGVGETITRPLDFAVPVPGQTAPVRLMLTMALRLDSIGMEGADRLARFSVALTGSTAGASATAIPLSIHGTGTLEWNVDRGFAHANNLVYEIGLSTSAGNVDGTIRVNSVTTY